jgi:hypothetical protein
MISQVPVDPYISGSKHHNNMEKFSHRSQPFAYFADFVRARAVASAAKPGAVRVGLDDPTREVRQEERFFLLHLTKV